MLFPPSNRYVGTAGVAVRMLGRTLGALAYDALTLPARSRQPGANDAAPHLKSGTLSGIYARVVRKKSGL
jgi:hypothetical protein